MKHLITLFLTCLSGSVLFSQNTVTNAAVNNSGVYSSSDLFIHNSTVRNGNLSFGGTTTSYAELPDRQSLNALNGTWCFTVNVTHATTGPGQSIISKTEAVGSYAGLHIFEDSGRIALQVKNYTNAQSLTIKSDYVAGTGSHFICVTFENNKSVKLFIDGVLKQEAKPPYFMFSKNPMRLGCSMDNFWKPFDGELTNIEIFSTALSNTDVTCLYNLRQAVGELFFIYPNPGQTFFNIELPKVETGKLVLIDMNGKEIYASDFPTSKNLTVNTESFAPGVYYVHITGSVKYEVQKVVVIK